MKRFNILLTLAIAFSMVAFAQNAPKGKMLQLPKMTKQTTKAMTFQAPHRAAPPATATVETDWVIEGGYINNNTSYTNENDISVAFDGNDVYVQGMVFLCPDAWLVGTISEDGQTVTFANGQYAGMYNGEMIYACGSTDGSSMDDIKFNYDAEAKKLELTNYYLENTDTESFALYFYSYDLVLHKDLSQPVPTNVTVDPSNTSAIIGWTENGDATSWNLRYRKLPEKLNRLWDFETVDQLEDWMVVDNDNDSICWEWANAGYNTHSGNGVMISASYDNDSKTALNPDNWLISPAIEMGGHASFWYRGQDPSYCGEVFAVYVFAGDQLTSLDDFVKIGDDVTATGEFQEYTIDLSQYQGYGCIAIRHYNVSDMFCLNIDDFCVEVPGGEYPGEWQVIEGVTNPYTLENLTPDAYYQVEVQAVGTDVSDWTAPVTFPTTPVYMLGGDDQGWDCTNGKKFEYDAEYNIYILHYTFPAETNYFGFTTRLAENNDQGGWDYIEPYRFGAVAEGENFIYYDDQYDGKPLDLTWDAYKAFQIGAGEYYIAIDLTSKKVMLSKVVPAHDYEVGDVNHDHAVNIADVTALIDYLLGSGSVCETCANVNGDEGINIADVTALIDKLLNNN